jgi:hypothetical protein
MGKKPVLFLYVHVMYSMFPSNGIVNIPDEYNILKNFSIITLLEIIW